MNFVKILVAKIVEVAKTLVSELRPKFHMMSRFQQ